MTKIRNNRATKILSSLTRATNRALTRAMQTGRTHATRAVSEELGIARAPVRKRLILERLTEDGFLAVSLRFTGKRLRLSDLGARQTRAGVSYRTRGGRAVARGAFMATMKSGHTGAFRRRTKARLPIVELYGASVAFAAVKNKILESTRDAAVAAFQKNHAHEVSRVLSGA